MPFEPDFETIAGTRLFIKAGKPTDNTEAAFETLFTAGAEEFEITSVPSLEGRAYDKASLTTLSKGQTREKPGTFTFAEAEFGIQWLPLSDAHGVADTAMKARTIVSCAVQRQGLGVLYFIAYVMNLSDSGGSSNDALVGTLTLLRQTDPISSLTPVVPTV